MEAVRQVEGQVQLVVHLGHLTQGFPLDTYLFRCSDHWALYEGYSEVGADQVS